MKPARKFSLSARIRSFGYAWRGLLKLIRVEHNFRIHLVVLICVLAAGFYFQIARWEWAAIISISAVVLVAEALNSALEHLSDAVSDRPHPLIKSSKDMAAAAVLTASIASIILAILLFLPYILPFFD